jgi:type II secretory pathway pseudopilin PulG
VLLMVALLIARVAPAAEPAAQKSFARARDAVAALVAANRTNDTAALEQILGPEGSSLISSGDQAQDKRDRAQFVALYEKHHRLTRTAPDTLTLLIGSNEWALPIPLVKQEGQWRFDTAAGAQELLYRRIGANELAAIQVARALYRAQLEYAASAHDGNEKGLYAQRFRSTPDKHDGLYWPVAEGEPASPAGPLVAEAEASGRERGKHQPFHGYYFRILKSQGPHARSGARDYVIDGKMSGGFAILAYPAEYGVSGVMSFLVSRRGTVFESDLGAATSETAPALTAFDPDDSWRALK